MLQITKNQLTTPARNAIKNIKYSVKKEVLDIERHITKSSPELKAKKEYMQSDEFLKDKDNVKMMSLYDDLIKHRDTITKNIDENNLNPKAQKQVQGTNGFARIKNFLDKNKKMNFWSEPSITDRANYDYMHTKTKIYNEAINIRKSIKK